MSDRLGLKWLQLICLLAAFPNTADAEYLELLKKGTDREALRQLYERYILPMTKESDRRLGGEARAAISEDQMALPLAFSSEADKQSFLLACLSNGWEVKAEDIERRYLPPSGVWAFSQKNYRGLVKQFPFDCKGMDCMDVVSLGGFDARSVLVGESVTAKLFSEPGFAGEEIAGSYESLVTQPKSIKLRTAPRIDYVTVSGYEGENGRASFRLHVSGANIDDGAKLIINSTQMPSTLDVRLDNSSWLGLGNDQARAGYNLDPTYFTFPIFHYDSITTLQQSVAFGTELTIQVVNSFGMISNALNYVVPIPAELDSDGDGLLDVWEKGSVDGLNLVELGANPHRKDVYVEVDRMIVPGRIWSDFSEQDYPNRWAMAEAQRAYASAPIINADRSTGISLHIDFGQEQFEQSSKSEGGTIIPWKRFIGFPKKTSFRQKYPEYSDIYELRNNPDYFSRSRVRVFRYCVFGDQQWASRSTGGGDQDATFFVSLGVCRMDAVDPHYQAAIFLHELGHLFGLRHNGNGGPQFRPNFNSLMNYKFRCGCDVDGKLGRTIRGTLGVGGYFENERVLSYSQGMRASLDESSLHEVLGVANHYPHDWNRNGRIENKAVAASIAMQWVPRFFSKINDALQLPKAKALDDFSDWANLKFKVLSAIKVVKRRQPSPLPQKIIGIAKVPAGVNFGFMCEVNGQIQIGHWKIVGKVTKHDLEKNLISFTTDEFRVDGSIRSESMTGHFAYRLPKGIAIAIDEGDPITILHDNERDDQTLEKQIHISSGKELILATSEFNEELIPQSAERAELFCEVIPGGMVQFYWSDPADDDVSQDLKAMPSFPAPNSIKCRTNGELITRADSGDDFQTIEIGNKRYFFMVLRDSLSEEAARTNGGSGDRSEDGLYNGGECLLLKVRSDLQQTDRHNER